MAKSKSGRSDKVLTPEFRLSFPALFEPTSMDDDPNSKKKYSITMLFPLGADLTPLKKAAHAACVDAFGADTKKWPKNLRTPFRDQGEKEMEGYIPKAIFTRASSKNRPGVVDKNVKAIIDPSEVYPGSYGKATINAYTYEVKGNIGVTFGLINYQKTRDGDPLGGRSRAEDDFDPIEGAEVGFEGDEGTSTEELAF